MSGQLLDEKSVVITGAGAGLGRAYACHAARSGANVVINDVDTEAARRVAGELRDEGWSAVEAGGDISDYDTAGKVVDRCIDQFGRIDGLVSNAAVFYMTVPWLDEPARIARLLDVNLHGVIFPGLHAMRAMVQQGSGSIVNITSGAQLGIPKMSVYGASKGGVSSLTYSWAVDLRGSGVRVNAVSPLARTNIAGDVGAARPEGTVDRPPLPDPDHVAPAVSYLLSDLSRSLHGQVLRLEGPMLTIVAHPRIPDIHVSRDEWTVEDIATAVDGPLAGLVQPVGRD